MPIRTHPKFMIITVTLSYCLLTIQYCHLKFAYNSEVPKHLFIHYLT